MSTKGTSHIYRSLKLLCVLALTALLSIQGAAWPSVAQAAIVSGLPPGYITTVAGDGQVGVTLNGLAVDAAGNLYIADTHGAVIRKVDTNGTITTVAGTGTAGYNGDNIKATEAQLNLPYRVAVDSAGNLYITDRSNYRLRVVPAVTGNLYGLDVTAGNIYTIAGTGTAGFSGENGSAAKEAMLKATAGIIVDASGNLYFCDGANFRIRKIDPSGNIWTVAGNGSQGSSNVEDNIAATSANLTPVGLDIDSAGNLYVTSFNRLRKIDTNGIITTVAGTGTAGYNDDGIATGAQLWNPMDVAVDAAGNLYIADLGNQRIRRVDTGGNLTTIAGNTGTGGNTGDGGPAVDAELQNPTSLAMDREGNLYIGTQNAVRYIQLAQTQADAPALMADGTDNTVGQDITLTFTDDEAWRSAITAITVDGSTLESGQYTVAEGSITIDRSVFPAAKDYTIVVQAAGYSDASVTQTVSAALTPPLLTAAAASVGQAVYLSFPDDAAWRSAITAIMVDSNALESGQYMVAEGSITIDRSVFPAAKDYTIVVQAAGYSDAMVTQTVGTGGGHPVYTVAAVPDAAYTTGTTPGGITTMTANSGVSGLKYFTVNITPVLTHSGKETVIFTQLRDGAQLSLNATRADFDLVTTAAAGFNVQAGDVINAYIVDELSNAIDSNPIILQ